MVTNESIRLLEVENKLNRWEGLAIERSIEKLGFNIIGINLEYIEEAIGKLKDSKDVV